MNETQERFPSLDVIFELAKEKLHFQSEQWNAIDSKNAIVLAVYGIVLAIFLNVDTECFLVCQKYILLFWLCITTLGIACSIISIRPRDIDIQPKISKLSEKYLQEDDYELLKWVLGKSNPQVVTLEYIKNRSALREQLMRIKDILNASG